MMRQNLKRLRPRQISEQFVRHVSLKIGCASGFWGDTAVSTPQLIHSEPKVDFIVYDFLSEITMSLLAKAKSVNPKLGYCPDFVHFHMAPHLHALKSNFIRVVANAGGVNPIACAEKLQEVASAAGIDIRIAAVLGDDLASNIDQYTACVDTESKAAFPSKGRLASINAYFGAEPIRMALDSGADIVVTGRCVDSALTLAPLMHQFNWSAQQYDNLAAGSLAGHLIECGAQCTGGIATDWNDIEGWDRIGFPIVAFDDSDFSKFQLTKPKRTGGRVKFSTVSEQLVYEIGDPSQYLLPDVTLDMSDVQIKETGEDVVTVSGWRGVAPSDKYKVSATYLDGYRCTAVSTVVGPNAVAKANKTGQAILKRCGAVFKLLGMEPFRDTHMRVIGDNSYAFGNCEAARSHIDEVQEAASWMAVRHDDKRALEFFAREVAPAGTGMAPGLTGLVGGRPKVSPVLRLFSFLAAKSDLAASVIPDIREPNNALNYVPSTTSAEPSNTSSNTAVESDVPSGTHSISLSELAYTRSGDKGDSVNIGVIARTSAFYPYLRHHLTSQVVEQHFSHLLTEDSKVFRYELPGVCGFNFVLTHALGGGGVASLRFDPQGKAMGQLLLNVILPSLPSIEDMLKT